MTRGATARLFVAADLPPAARAELAHWARAAAVSARGSGGHLRLLAPDSLHVTLCFLGSVVVAEIEAIADIVSGSPAETVGELSLGAPLWLPARRPRALAVELHDDAQGALGSLQSELARTLVAIGALKPERRRFRPHVTVARMRSADAPQERSLPATPALAFAPVALTLYRSWLGPTEATYEALARCPLGTSEEP
ncbi:MAG TPA: RNA 2',3'-cyclic phosphodiesterase [Solirubrobacteraceae bacterium]|jgi:2'-5' RNA ligase